MRPDPNGMPMPQRVWLRGEARSAVYRVLYHRHRQLGYGWLLGSRVDDSDVHIELSLVAAICDTPADVEAMAAELARQRGAAMRIAEHSGLALVGLWAAWAREVWDGREHHGGAAQRLHERLTAAARAEALPYVAWFCTDGFETRAAPVVARVGAFDAHTCVVRRSRAARSPDPRLTPRRLRALWRRLCGGDPTDR